MTVDFDVAITRVKDGDIVLFTVPTPVPPKSLTLFRRHVVARIAELGVNAAVFVCAGDVRMRVARKDDLEDIRKSLDALEANGQG